MGRANVSSMRTTAKDKIILSVFSVLWTIFIAGVTIGMFHVAGLDPRNDFWGATLSNIGVLAIFVFGWPAGIYQIWFGD